MNGRFSSHRDARQRLGELPTVAGFYRGLGKWGERRCIAAGKVEIDVIAHKEAPQALAWMDQIRQEAG